jgi:hypothetical protein
MKETEGHISAIHAEEEIAREQQVELPLGYEVTLPSSFQPHFNLSQLLTSLPRIPTKRPSKTTRNTPKN